MLFPSVTLHSSLPVVKWLLQDHEHEAVLVDGTGIKEQLHILEESEESLKDQSSPLPLELL